MTQQINESNSSVTALVMGTRRDHVPAPETQQLFSKLCVNCQMETVTEIEYADDFTLVCNVCAPAVTEQLLHEQQAHLVFDMPPDVKTRMIDAANRLGIPYEALVLRFAAWRTGKLMEGKVNIPPVKKQ